MELYVIVEKYIVASKNNVNISAFSVGICFQDLLVERGWGKDRDRV